MTNMPESPAPSRQPAAVAGGSSAVPTPANQSTGWGDKTFRKGGSADEPINEGEGHVSVCIYRFPWQGDLKLTCFSGQQPTRHDLWLPRFAGPEDARREQIQGTGWP